MNSTFFCCGLEITDWHILQYVDNWGAPTHMTLAPIKLNWDCTEQRPKRMRAEDSGRVMERNFFRTSLIGFLLILYVARSNLSSSHFWAQLSRARTLYSFLTAAMSVLNESGSKAIVSREFSSFLFSFTCHRQTSKVLACALILFGKQLLRLVSTPPKWTSTHSSWSWRSNGYDFTALSAFGWSLVSHHSARLILGTTEVEVTQAKSRVNYLSISWFCSQISCYFGLNRLNFSAGRYRIFQSTGRRIPYRQSFAASLRAGHSVFQRDWMRRHVRPLQASFSRLYWAANF